MMLSGTYGCANIIMLANSLMLYNTKEMCVFVSIYLIAVIVCTYVARSVAPSSIAGSEQ